MSQASFKNEAKNEAGFSLIEALVALAILAVSAAALITAAEHHVRRIGQLEARAGALQAAQNHLAEMQGGAPVSATHDIDGVRYETTARTAPTDDSAILSVRVSAAEAGRAGELAVLDGFVLTDAASQARGP